MPTNTPGTDDDIYVNEGDSYQNGIYYPGAPEAQEAEIAGEESVKAGSYPILPDLHEWFSKEIAACDNMHNIQVGEMTIAGTVYSRKVSVEAQVLAYQLLKEKFMEKAKEFEDFAKDLR